MGCSAPDATGPRSRSVSPSIIGSSRSICAITAPRPGPRRWPMPKWPRMCAPACAALGYRRFALLGHSMGGKVAMLAALRDPGSVERLVVADIAPVAYRPRHLGMVQAMRGLDLAGVERRAEADALSQLRCRTRRSAAFCCRTWYSRAARRDGGSISRLSSARCLFWSAFRRYRRGRSMTGRRCLSAAGGPTICAPSTNRKSGFCFRRRGSPASRRPVTGCTPSGREAFLDLVEPFLAG